MPAWHTPGSASEVWADAPYDEADLTELLEVARGQVIEYVPKSKRAAILPADSAAVPPNYRRAQLEQAKNIWTAGAVDAAGGLGDGESFAMSPHPLDWHIKQLIRPRGGAPRVR